MNLVAAIAVLVTAQTADGTWQTRASMTPSARMDHASAGIGGTLFTFGGMNLLNGQPDYGHSIAKYDPITDAWTTLQQITTAGFWQGVCGCPFGGSAYQFGGFTFENGSIQGSAFRYDPAANAWTRLADMPSPLRFARCAATSTQIWVAGGEDLSAAASNACFAFDPTSGTWSTGPTLPAAAVGHHLGSVDDRVFLAGGYANSIRANFSSSMTATYEMSSSGWSYLSDLPTGLAEGAATTALGKWYLVGGGWSGRWDEVYEMDPATGTWTQRASMPLGCVHHAAATVTVNGLEKIYATGGWDGAQQPDPRCLEYSPPTPPTLSGLSQRKVNQTDLPEGSWIGGTPVELGGTLTDGYGARCRIQVEFIPASESFTGIPNYVGSPFVPSGTVQACVVTPQVEGAWKWKARAQNEIGLSSPWVEFGTPATDLNVDLTGPSAPGSIAPQGSVTIADRHGESIRFEWTGATDDRPEPVTYEIQVSVRSDFGTAVHAVQAAGTSINLWMTPSVNDQFYYWRVRAIDSVGNAGAWSVVLSFTVSWDDGKDHGAGDAKFCGFSAGSAGNLPAILLMALFVFCRHFSPARELESPEQGT